MRGKKDPFNEGKDVDIFDVINSVRIHYVNNKEDFNKGNSKDAATIALTTKLNILETKMKLGPNKSLKLHSGKGKLNDGKKSVNDNKKQTGLPKWRITCRGNEITQDGVEVV
eukprot:14230110-Ditylum_brightwellii.AAC.1